MSQCAYQQLMSYNLTWKQNQQKEKSFSLGTAQFQVLSSFGLSWIQFSSVTQSCVTRWPHEPQHARPPCPSPTPRAYSNSCPLSWWCHLTIASSVIPFSSYPQSFPASESFQMNQFFTSGGQSIRISAYSSVLPVKIQGWFPVEWTCLISLLSKGLSRVFSRTITTIRPSNPTSAYISKRTWKQDVEEITASIFSLKYYSQQPRYRNNLRVHQGILIYA